MTPSKLPRKCTGDDPLVDYLNAHNDCILERTLIAGNGIRARYTTKGTVIDASVAAEVEPTTFKVYGIASVHADYLECYDYYPDENRHDVTGPRTNVAKYWDLQKSYYDGKTIDGYSYTGRAGGPPFAIPRMNPYVRRSRTQVGHVGEESPEESQQYRAGVNFVEMVSPPYNSYYTETDRFGDSIVHNGGLIAAFDMEKPITLPAIPLTIDGLDVGQPEIVLSKMEIPYRRWVTIEHSILICETVGGQVLQRRVKVPCSESYPVSP